MHVARKRKMQLFNAQLFHFLHETLSERCVPCKMKVSHSPPLVLKNLHTYLGRADILLRDLLDFFPPLCYLCVTPRQLCFRFHGVAKSLYELPKENTGPHER